MPYLHEYSSKVAHAPLVNSPQVQAFLRECRFHAPLTTAHATSLAAGFHTAPTGGKLPRHILAVDGSLWESALNAELPTTQVGYLQIASVQFDLAAYQQLRRTDGLVDPFAVATLMQGAAVHPLCLPSANLLWTRCSSVRDSFRAVLEAFLRNTVVAGAPLRDTLFHLAALRPGRLSTGTPLVLLLHHCPTCGQGPVPVMHQLGDQACHHCGAPVHAADCLRVWEEVQEGQSNAMALGRTMLLLEHLLLIHHLWHLELPTLADTIACLDGPGALFGPASWLHAPIQRWLHEQNERLRRAGHGPLLFVAIQKSGQLVEHARRLAPHLAPGQLRFVDDAYRYQEILISRAEAEGCFGRQTYYCQDVLFKSATHKLFVLGLPLCVPDKYSGNFNTQKVELAGYPQLGRLCATLEALTTDLYPDALVPLVLAHHAASISRAPGGQMLDQLARHHLLP